MVSLAEAVGHFGYEVYWADETRTVYILADGDVVGYVTLDVNSYNYRNHIGRELEIAPMSFDDTAYVPLSFFNEIMGIPTTVSQTGINMSRYPEPLTSIITDRGRLEE